MASNFDEEIAGAMMEGTGEMPSGDAQPVEDEGNAEADVIANIADELSSLTGKEVSIEQVQGLIDAIVSDESGSEDGSEAAPEGAALPDDFT